MWILEDVILIITQSLKSKIFWEVLSDVSQQEPQYGPCSETTRIKLQVPRVYGVKPHGGEEWWVLGCN